MLLLLLGVRARFLMLLSLGFTTRCTSFSNMLINDTFTIHHRLLRIEIRRRWCLREKALLEWKATVGHAGRLRDRTLKTILMGLLIARLLGVLNIRAFVRSVAWLQDRRRWRAQCPMVNGF